VPPPAPARLAVPGPDWHSGGRKPVLAIWASPVRDDDGYRLLCAAGVPLFHSMTAGVRGARALLDHRRRTENYACPSAALPAADPARVEAGRAMLRTAGA